MTMPNVSPVPLHPEAIRLSEKWFRKRHETLNATERAILDAVHTRTHVARAPDHVDQKTLGERMADRVAEFGGSWTFIMLFGAFLMAWAAFNTLLAVRAFDPYPFIFLNLILSMIAAVQAPVIMMSQNRQAQKDRENAEHDYAVNLKAELEIMGLHEKLDELRTEQITRLLAYQAEQMELLTKLIERK
jgi:uncharacterized membrane protein